MGIQWRPLDRAKAYELVVRQLKEEIFAGRLQPGDRLPGERQLSELLEVSRPSIREAVRIMQTLEVVQSRPGNGADSGLIITAKPRRALEELLELHLALASYSTIEVLNVRVVLESQVVRELIEERRPLSQVDEILKRLSVPHLSRADYLELDTEFHLNLAQATGNRLLSDLMLAIREVLRKLMERSFDGANVWPEKREKFVQEHIDIVDAIRARDTDKALTLVRSHIVELFDTFP